MFRKPMRLEKWIAFDGAAAAELPVDTDVDNDSFLPFEVEYAENDHNPADNQTPDAIPTALFEFGVLDAFGASPLDAWQDTNTLLVNFPEFPQHDGAASLTFPIGLDRPAGCDPDSPFYAPFLKDFDAELTIDPSAAGDIELRHMFVGISFSDNGSFSIYSSAEGMSFSSFVRRNNIPVGTVMAYSPEGIPHWGVWTGTIRIGTVVRYGSPSSGMYGLDDTYHVARGRIYDGSLRIGFLSTATTEDATIVLNSLIYRPNSHQTEGGDSFQVSMFHDRTGTVYSPSKLTSGSNSAFVPGKSSGAIEDATRPCDTDGSVIDGGSPSNPEPPPPTPPTDPELPDPDPDPDPPGPPDEPETPIPEPILPPIIPDPSPSGEGDGTGTDGDAGMPGGDAEAPSDDGPGWYGAYDEQDEDEDIDAGSAGSSSASGIQNAREDAGSDQPDEVEVEAAFAPGGEVIHEAALTLREIKAAHAALAAAAGRLHAEYALIPARQWAEQARESLAGIFDAGNHWKTRLANMDRLLSAGAEQMRLTPPERRDGMMREAMREVIDSSARHAGSAKAYAAAMDSLALELRQAREAGLAAPEGDAIAAAFAKAHEANEAKWRELALRHDPMGRELDLHARLRGGTDLAKSGQGETQ